MMIVMLYRMTEEIRADAHDEQPIRLPDEVIEALFLLSTAAVGFFLNITIIACLLSVSSLRTISSFFVLHGCLLDAVKCLYSVPFATSLLRRGPPNNCAVLGGSFVLLVTASALNIVATVCSEAYSFRFITLNLHNSFYHYQHCLYDCKRLCVLSIVRLSLSVRATGKEVDKFLMSTMTDSHFCYFFRFFLICSSTI